MNVTTRRRAPLAALLCTLGLAAPAAAQQPAPVVAPRAPFDLSVKNIMRGERLVGRSPNEVRWSPNSRWVYFRWRDPEARDTATHVYRVAATGGAPQLLADSAADRLVPGTDADWTPERSRMAFERRGDIFVADAATGRERRITDTPGRERSPQISPDGRTVYFLQGNNVFAVAVEGGPYRQLTDLRREDAPRRDTLKGSRLYLQEQQRELLGVIRDRVAERRRREEVDSLRATVRPVYLGKNTTVSDGMVSPSGRYLLLEVEDEPQGVRQAMVPNFVTESGYTEPMNVREKVGDVRGATRVAVVELATGQTRWLEPEAKDRRVSLLAFGWGPGGDRALVMGVAFDFKDRWIYVAGPDGKTATVDHDRDTAWVQGPNLYATGWLRDGRVWFLSEKTGWSHLYTVSAAGGPATALTSGSWEVTSVEPSADGRAFTIVTGETHPGERAVYSVPAGGGARTRLTPMQGWTEGGPSPDGRWLAVLHSTADAPPELYLQANRAGAQPRRVTTSTTAEFRAGPWIRPEVVRFRARDGQTVYARIYRPRELGAQPHGGAVLFVHGAGYLQNAHRGWSTYYREYMFNQLLASRGYTVMDVDYRGSAGYGAAWRTGVYRHMGGGKDLEDHVDAVRWLVANEGVDAKRVGIYGGSYGGLVTLMAMFREPDTFRSGAALRSVTDYAHYNHWYASRILNQPQDDSLAYRRSSPIYYAEGLRGDLLIAHGMVDTNVHFQDVVRLSQRLIELGKTHWELAVYPVEDHGFTRPESWTDEYRRILELFERTLRPGSPPLPS
jgi:dipeptidyl aminopeptidase/acylaminoacyl peptidase